MPKVLRVQSLVSVCRAPEGVELPLVEMKNRFTTFFGAGSASMFGRALWSLPRVNPCLVKGKFLFNLNPELLALVSGVEVQPTVYLR